MVKFRKTEIVKEKFNATRRPIKIWDFGMLMLIT